MSSKTVDPKKKKMHSPGRRKFQRESRQPAMSSTTVIKEGGKK